jgi:hypothetical protein
VTLYERVDSNSNGKPACKLGSGGILARAAYVLNCIYSQINDSTVLLLKGRLPRWEARLPK